MNTIQKFTLPNGLRLLIHEDHRWPLVSITSMFRGGLLVEDAKTNGLTHLLKNTIIKRTHTKSAERIARTLEQVGSTIDGSGCQCSCTSRSGTDDTFSISVDVMKPHLQLGLSLLAEILSEPIFSEVEVAREKKKQLAAIKAEDHQIENIAFKLLRKNLFGTHLYAHQALGTAALVESFTPAMLREFHEQYVVGHNGVVAIFGDVNTEEVIALATKVFASLPSGALAFESLPSIELLTAPLHEQAIQSREQAVIMKGFLGAALSSPDRPALEMLAAACCGLGSRLFKEIRDKLALVYFINGGVKMGLAAGSFGFSLGVDPKKSAFALEELNHCIDQLVQNGLTIEELNEAKKKLIHSEALARQSNTAFGEQVASNELMGLGFEHTYHRAKEVNNVTLEQVNHVIKKYLGVPNFVEVVVGPTVS